MTKLDKALICGAVFAANLLWALYLAKEPVPAVLMAFLSTAFVCRIGSHFLERKEIKGKISVASMENLLALNGFEFQLELIQKATPQYFGPEAIDGGMLLTMNCQKTAVFPNYKYSPSTLEDIAKFYRQAKRHSVAKVYLLSRANPRNVQVLAASLDIPFTFVPSRKLHRYLYSRNLLMEEVKVKKPRVKRPLKEVLADIFQRRRAKYFFISALSLALITLITPYKIYYLILTTLSVIMGVGCLFAKA